MSATLQKNVLAHLFKIHLPHAAGLVLLEGEKLIKPCTADSPLSTLVQTCTYSLSSAAP